MRQKLKPIILLLPFMIMIGLFCIGILNGILQSIGIIPAFNMNTPTLKYYIEVFQNKSLLQSIGYSLWIAIASSISATLIGVFLCYVILSLKKSQSAWINVIKLPVLIPHMVVAVFVISIFSQTGLLARLLYHLGIIVSEDSFPQFLFTSNGIGIIWAYLWKEVPFVCYFVMAVMASISENLEQAAMGLGATRFKSFFYVTLPLCVPAIRNAFLIIFAFSFGAYELPFLLGSTLPKALPVQAYIEYTHPDLQHRPYAMALNVIMIALSFLICICYFKYLKKVDNQYEK